MIDYVAITEEIRQFAETHEKKSRYEHSVRVAETCAQLCRHYGLDDNKGYLAGIAHDICKDFSDDELFDLASKDGREIFDVEKRKPALLHGRAAAILMQSQFKITDKELIEAVAVHTSGEIGMCDLSKCLWLADKIEPGRSWSTDEYRNNLMNLPLKKMFYKVFKENYDCIIEKGYEVYPTTIDVLNYYKADSE